MLRYFNTAGPCRPDKHYMLPAEKRLPGVRAWIDREAYFVLHAPRQTGKTTSVRALAEALTAEGHYAALLTSCEVGNVLQPDLEASLTAVLEALAWNAANQLPPELRPPPADGSLSARTRLLDLLSRWADSCPRPLAIFFDEIDALVGEALNSVLRQLRSGYDARPRLFPHTIALVGLRDVRDYRVLGRSDAETFGSPSPFNVKIGSIRLADFSRADVAELYAQHEAETGQSFTAAAVDLVHHLSGGQPWLVNALAAHCVEILVPDRGRPIGEAEVLAAKNALIVRRETHLESLVDKLREPRIRRVVGAILAGDQLSPETLDDDVAYTVDLGLVRRGEEGIGIANPIYREIVPRALTDLLADSIEAPRSAFVDAAGRLQIDRLLDGLMAFWRENSEILLQRAWYPEAAAQLVAMAFLHRVVNGGGTIDREFAVGRGRVDLCLRWPVPGKAAEVQRFAFELKVWRDGSADPAVAGLEQLAGYLDRLGLEEGTLVVFDARTDAPPIGQRCGLSALHHESRRIRLLRL